MDYITGRVDNGSYDLNKAMKILRSNSCVRNIEEIDIPYYNAEEGRTKAIEFTVLLPQNIHDGLCKRRMQQTGGHSNEKYRGNGRCGLIRDMIASVYDGQPDILHLKPAKRSDGDTD